jgi:hypothetical protein
VEKSTNGEDADNTNGPKLNIGDTVTWTYVVTNTGNEPVGNIALQDDKEGIVTCPKTSLDIGESMTCVKTGTAQAGNYANTATVTAKGTWSNTPVSDNDPSHYHVIPPVDKATISGNVRVVDQAGHYTPLSGVVLVLFDDNGNEVARTKTNSNGYYSFTAYPGRYYIQEIQPKDYYSVSEDEGGADNDANNPVINTVSVILDSQEHDIQNDFVESRVNPNVCNVCKPTICNSCAACAAETISSDEVKLRWRPTENENGYEIYVNGKFVATVAKDVTTYTLKGLESDKSYNVEIVALGVKGGTVAQTLSFKTPPVKPAAWLPAIYGILLN